MKRNLEIKLLLDPWSVGWQEKLQENIPLCSKKGGKENGVVQLLREGPAENVLLLVEGKTLLMQNSHQVQSGYIQCCPHWYLMKS